MHVKVAAYRAGTPCWIDLGVADVPAALAFYGGLFGWTGEAGPPETGGYVMCLLDGAPVAGIGPLMPEQPSNWNTYLASDDLDDTLAKVESAGGKVLAPAMDIMTLGRMSMIVDSAGALLGTWQGLDFKGCGVVNEPGSLVWNELLTRDVDAAKAFYGSVFGVDTVDSDASGDVAYLEWQVDGGAVGGMMSLDAPQFPVDLPSHWMTYFATGDLDASVATVTALGGSVSVPPTELPFGRFAVVADPAGAFFSLIQMA
jgi:predicted enzyme related to lactoylglutathione lyase